jgi:hypothetical protein
MREARGSKMRLENVFGSREAKNFVLLAILEFLILLGSIFVPNLILGHFVGIILIALVHFTYLIALVMFLLRGLRTFRAEILASFSTVLILVLITFVLFFLNQKSGSIRFLIFRGFFTDFAQRVINQEFPVQSGSIFEEVSVPFKFFFIGKGQVYRIGRTEVENNSMVFFQQSGFFDQDCGYIYSTKNQIPFQLGGGNEATYSLVFQLISKNWFYGCMNYEG